MELADVMVRLGGSLFSVVHMRGVTPLEYRVLMEVHGHGSLHDGVITGEREIDPEDELARLQDRYGAKALNKVVDMRAPLVPKTFSKLRPKVELPRAASAETEGAKPTKRQREMSPPRPDRNVAARRDEIDQALGNG